MFVVGGRAERQPALRRRALAQRFSDVDGILMLNTSQLPLRG
ncbi:hypothetical protein [Pseudomonas emilianonis]|nr:hypothetical protein [Pseudomonas emilianonis]